MYEATVISAPGKLLVTGGYLILDPQYRGLVLSLDSRVFVKITLSRKVESVPNVILVPDITLDGDSGTNEHGDKISGVSSTKLRITCPQFTDTNWEFQILHSCQNEKVNVEVKSILPNKNSGLHTRNVYIESVLQYTFSYLVTFINTPLPSSEIQILTDRKFYSDSCGSSTHLSFDDGELIHKDNFMFYGLPLCRVPKTGLGSSAALTTALVGAIMSFYLPSSTFTLSPAPCQALLRSDSLNKLFNLALLSHFSAQGKLGSGFDIAASTFGSCLYQRPDFSEASSIIDAMDKISPPRLRHYVENKNLKMGINVTLLKYSSYKLPEGFHWVLCDINAGTKTTEMVQHVLNWRKDNSENAEALWNDLNFSNEMLLEDIMNIANLNKNEIVQQKSFIIKKLRNDLERIRKLLRQLGDESGQPIEPELQNKLLDACIGNNEVIGGFVPGAGGNDATLLLLYQPDSLVSNEHTSLLKQLELVYREYKKGCSDHKFESPIRLLNVQEGSEGVKIEEFKTN